MPITIETIFENVNAGDWHYKLGKFISVIDDSLILWNLLHDPLIFATHRKQGTFHVSVQRYDPYGYTYNQNDQHFLCA